MLPRRLEDSMIWPAVQVLNDPGRQLCAGTRRRKSRSKERQEYKRRVNAQDGGKGESKT